MSRLWAVRRRSAHARVLRRGRSGGRLWVAAACVAGLAADPVPADEPRAVAAPAATLDAGAATGTVPGLDAADALPGGFPADGLRVERGRIFAGGPKRDGIPSVDAPRFTGLPEAGRWVRGEHPVVGVAFEGEARAYPIHLLEHHQVVNDRFGERGVVVTYDPLIDVARAFLVPSAPTGLPSRPPEPEPEPEPELGRFGVSGLIYRCNFLLYDRIDASIWTQFDGQALTGARAGTRLQPIRVRVESMRRWAKRHPETRVLRPPAPKRIDYRYRRYSSYWVSETVPFALDHTDERIHPKEIVLGARVGDTKRAYLATVIERRGGRIVDELAGHRIRIEWEPSSGTFGYEAPEAVEVTSAFWFAWKNFHPETELWNLELEPSTGAAR